MVKWRGQPPRLLEDLPVPRRLSGRLLVRTMEAGVISNVFQALRPDIYDVSNSRDDINSECGATGCASVTYNG